MKKIILAGIISCLTQLTSAQVNSRLQAYAKELSYNKQKQLSFVSLKETPQVSEKEVADFINTIILNNTANKVVLLKTENDKYGFSHTRYGIQQKGTTLYNKVIIAHCRNGRLESLNGDLRTFAEPANGYALSEKNALAAALKKVNAKKYKWENKEEEAHMRKALRKPDFSFSPTGVKTVFEKEGKSYNAYQFTIYAEEPLYRAHVFVDAATGKILGEQNLICNVNVPGTAATLYSGTQNITCDLTGGVYSLRETQRGLGVETYNLGYTSNYNNTDFTSPSANFTGVNADQGARDAHWGAESTYDYYNATFGYNSIDNAGFALLSYVHYNTNFNNAFWDGLRMTYGDGDNTLFTIFTGLDVCGHEITHGLVSNTANLGGSGSDECDALNEGFADIFGTSIERFTRPLNWNWIMGNEITVNNNGIRNMSNPNQLGDPDTYQGNFWDPNGEPHANAGPCIYWYYLLVNGGSGTNDNNNVYNITGIGNTDAEQIAFRALTVYFTPSTDYAEARAGAIQAAKDLFGNCSNQVQQTASAWYAVGVGGPYSNSVIGPDFQAPITSYCGAPANAVFNNTTSNGITYTWDFGDGATSTATNAVHTYTANGTYSVKLKATGCANALDSIVKTAYIVINSPSTPIGNGATQCGPGSVVLSASGNALLNWYASPGSTLVLGSGNNFTTPNLTASTTFYVVNAFASPAAYGGMLLNQPGTSGGYLNNNFQWLIFDVLQNSTLNSVEVFVQTGTAGNRTIELRDAFGTPISSTTANLAVGSNTIILNYNLTPGTNYQLGLSNSSASSLYRHNGGVSYPYNIGNCVDITGSSAGGSFYYFFYRWKVTKEPCASVAVPVVAVINDNPVAALSAPVSQVCMGDAALNLNGSPSGGTYSGIGTTGSSFDPTSAGIGQHTIVYTYTDANGCSGTDNLVLDVSECTGISSQALTTTRLSIYPNPVTDQVTVKSDLKGPARVIITDASGRTVLSHNLSSSEEVINTAALAKGMYVLSLRDASDKTLKAVKLVKD